MLWLSIASIILYAGRKGVACHSKDHFGLTTDAGCDTVCRTLMTVQKQKEKIVTSAKLWHTVSNYIYPLLILTVMTLPFSHLAPAQPVKQ